MRVRITFSKTGPLRYIGQLDLQALWERAARRAGLPLAYSQGFHPQPKINFGSALPLGFSSRCELVDLRLNEDVDPAMLPAQLEAVMPDGIRVQGAVVVDEHEPSLPVQIVSAEYEAALTESADGSDDPESLKAALKAKAAEMLTKESLPRERRGKSYDLRPLIEALEVRDDGVLWMRLAAREGATGRPDEVLAELGYPIEVVRVERTALLMKTS